MKDEAGRRGGGFSKIKENRSKEHVILRRTLCCVCVCSRSNAGFMVASPETGLGVRKFDMLQENVIFLTSQRHDQQYQ